MSNSKERQNSGLTQNNRASCVPVFLLFPYSLHSQSDDTFCTYLEEVLLQVAKANSLQWHLISFPSGALHLACFILQLIVRRRT